MPNHLRQMITNSKKRSDIKKHPVIDSGFAVYRGTNELPQKTFWKTFCIFQNIWKYFQTIFFRQQYRFRMIISLLKDLLIRRSSMRLGWWYGWFYGFLCGGFQLLYDDEIITDRPEWWGEDLWCYVNLLEGPAVKSSVT